MTQKALIRAWHLVPKLIRVQCYRMLLRLGRYLYPPSFTGLVHRLPLGLYAKECNRSHRNEATTLQIVGQCTSISAPLWVDEYEEEYPFLIMTALPGQTLDSVFHRLSYPEREQLLKDLKSVISQVRSIPNRSSYAFANSFGGPLVDCRLPVGICGPFHLLSEFHAYLVHKLVRKETKDNIAAVHARLYRPVFTHADLNPTNIIMDRGRLSGIVDWECAGFFPDYWEFTKLMYGTSSSSMIRPFFHDAFIKGVYEEELEAEVQLWNDTPFGR